MAMAGGVCYSSAAVLTVALLMLVSVSSFGFSPHPNVRLRRNGHDRYTSTTSITTTSSSRRCSSSRQQRRDITCGLQVVVRIRGKKSREEDYTNQVQALLKSFLACKPRLHALHAYDEYVKRLRPVLSLDTQWHKTDQDLEAAVRKDAGTVVCLDEGGRQMNSPAFSDFLFSKLEEGGSRLTFVVGGAEGLPPGLKSNPPAGGAKLSLSSMTFTHLWARALLAEQIYRASEIRRGSKYHKE